MDIGSIIKKLRQQKHMTQENLAEGFGSNCFQMGKWNQLPRSRDFARHSRHISCDNRLPVGSERRTPNGEAAYNQGNLPGKFENGSGKHGDEFSESCFSQALGYSITEEDGNIILVVDKEFGEEFVKMRFN